MVMHSCSIDYRFQVLCWKVGKALVSRGLEPWNKNEHEIYKNELTPAIFIYFYMKLKMGKPFIKLKVFKKNCYVLQKYTRDKKK